MTVLTFLTPGTYPVTVPDGVSRMRVQLWAPGGRGSFGSTADSGSSGGGGEYAEDPSYPVIPGDVVSLVVGAGGATLTSFDGSGVVAHGGGNAASAFSPGAGGDGSTAPIHFPGGDGQNGFPGQQFGNHAGGAGGAGGAGSAGPGSDGFVGTTNSFPPGGSGGPPDGGDGGTGAPYPQNGNAGQQPGGGGSGGGSIMPPATTTGGGGGAGKAILTYTPAVSVTAQPATTTITMLPGSITSSLNIEGPAAVTTVTMLPGTVTGADTHVAGPPAVTQVVMLAGGVIGAPVTIAGPVMTTTVNALAGAVIKSTGSASVRAERASLVLDGQIELLAGGVPSAIPACAGAVFMLAPGYDFGAQVPVVDITGELITDGERLFGRRSSNRTLTLPVVITAPKDAEQDAAIGILSAARETLAALIDQQAFTVTWTRDNGFPLVWDCFRASAVTLPYSLNNDRQLCAQMTISMQALPYGRSDIPEQLSFDAPVDGAPAPPPNPVLLDDYEAVAAGQAGWSLSSSRITGLFSVHWSGQSSNSQAPSYTSSFGPASIAGRQVLQHWAGFAAPDFFFFFQSGPMTVSFAYTLRDASGGILQFGSSATVTPGSGSTPNWVLVSANIPQVSGFDFGNVASCTITISNFGGLFNNTDAWLDDLTAQPVSTPAVANVRGKLYILHGVKGTSHAPLALQFEQEDGSNFKTLIAHRPGPDAPQNFTPFVSTTNVSDPPDGRQYLIPPQIPGRNARFQGTYSIVAIANSWANPGAERTVTITVTETEYSGGPSTAQSVPRTFTPSTDILNGVAVIGELTLPGRDIPPDNTSMIYTLGCVSSEPGDQFLDFLLLDTQGQTLILNQTQAYKRYFYDEPTTDRDLGGLYASASNRTQAASVLANAFPTGGPLTVDPGDNPLFVWSVEGTPSLTCIYSPRWYLDRTDS